MVAPTTVRALATAMIFIGFGTARAEVINGTGFENDAVGTINPLLLADDSDFGSFSGGTVQAPGSTINADFTLSGQNVYFGEQLFYTNILPGPFHCCGFFRMEMLLATRGPVLIEIFGHDAKAEDPIISETLMFSTTVQGLDIAFGWGVPAEPDEDGEFIPGLQSDITSIRWTTMDDQAFAIDNVRGVGAAAIPEPASWALLIAGFGLLGARMRHRRRMLA